MERQFGHLEPYNITSSWRSYEERVEFYFEANAVKEDSMKRAIFLTMVGEVTYDIIRSLSTPHSPRELSYKKIIELLNGHFNPAPNEIIQRYNFNRRNQRKTESIPEFTAALQKLSENCNFSELDNMLRDRIVCGIFDESLQRKLFSEPNLTFKRAYELAVAHETAQKNVYNVRNDKWPETENILKVQKTDKKQEIVCFRCGANHRADSCNFKNIECRYCKKTGHLMKTCFKKKRDLQNSSIENNLLKRCNNVDINQHLDDEDFYTLNTITSVHSNSKFIVFLTLNNEEIPMEVDSGAACTIISRETWILIGKPKLETADMILQTWSTEKLEILGRTLVQVKYRNISKKLPIIIVSGSGVSLLGRDWFPELAISISGINSITDNNLALTNLLVKYNGIFDGELRQNCGKEIHIELEKNSVPKFLKYRTVPFALKPAVEREIEKLVSQGILQPVQFSEWATPVVPVRKHDGTIRLCGDYRTTVNPVIKKNTYPLPTIADVLSTVSSGKIFAKLDLTQAYQQLAVDRKSAEVLTINTHKGLFLVKRLPFGISAAPGIFQRYMDQLLVGIQNVIAYLDDIFISGKNISDINTKLEEVFKRLQEAQLSVNKKKCKFNVTDLNILGFQITAEGVKPSKEKVEAIHNAPEPKNKQELQAFLGLINFYNRFLKNKTDVAKPLYSLLESKSQWKWNSEHSMAFGKLKSLLKSDLILTHFDPNKMLVLSCDASPYGVGAVLSHREVDGSEKPIAFTSRTLGPSEKNFGHIDKEALSIIYGLKHFHQYIAGRSVIVVTDHKPLLGLFNPNKQLPVIISPRMLRWSLLMTTYDYQLEYRPGNKHGNADGLSRLPLQSRIDENNPPGDILLLEALNKPPFTAKQICQLTQKDKILKNISYWVLHGWPERKLEDEYQAYGIRKHELSLNRGCLLWGNRAREDILKLLHAPHPGMVAMKACARSYVWWPKLDFDIENCVRICKSCQENRNSPPKAPIQMKTPEQNPWRTLHLDFAGPFKNHLFLIVVDSMSKWLEVELVSSTSTAEVVRTLRKLFATLGIPDRIITDNGTAFTSEEMKQFAINNNIKLHTSAAYHPSSNGQAERMVQTTKKSVSQFIEGDMKLKLARFLFKQHTIPNITTGKSPAELLMGRKLRTVFDKMHPDNITIIDKENTTSKTRNFEEDDLVYIRNFGQGSKWVAGRVSEVRGPVSYETIAEDGRIAKKHVDQLRRRYPVVQPFSAQEGNHQEQTNDSQRYSTEIQDEQTEIEDTQTPSLPSENLTKVPTSSPRPVRDKKLPAYLADYKVTLK